jgi:hypothetical protein
MSVGVLRELADVLHEARALLALPNPDVADVLRQMTWYADMIDQDVILR